MFVCFFWKKKTTVFVVRIFRKISTEVVDGEPDELGTCQAQIFGLFLARRHLGDLDVSTKIRGRPVPQNGWWKIMENPWKTPINPWMSWGETTTIFGNIQVF